MFMVTVSCLCYTGNPQLVRILLERNADFTAADGNGATALHYVAQSNFSDTVKVFLSFDKINDIPDNEGRTALMWAAGKGWYKSLYMTCRWNA